MTNKKIYEIKDSKKLPDCEVEITVEIQEADIKPYKDKALKRMKEVAEMPGFRKGFVPEKMLLEKIGELGLLEEALELAINDCAMEIIAEKAPNFVGRPDVSISKIAIGSPLEFKVRVATMPEVKLGDYKKIAVKENGKTPEKITVEEKQIDETVEEIRAMWARQNHTHKEGEKHSEEEKLDLPEVNEEFVKKLGDFKTIADFRDKIKEGIMKEKEQKAQDKKKLTIIEEIIKESKIEMPKALVLSELNKMQAQFEDDITRMGMKPEDYLKHIKKTWEELRKEWADDAEKRAKLQVIVHNIAITEKIEAKKEEVETEVKHLMEQYKDASIDRVRIYVESNLINKMVFDFLEAQKN
jgi:FKBP-type peptidyl-prolyl cis-trans isomerase (trigger factor)